MVIIYSSINIKRNGKIYLDPGIPPWEPTQRLKIQDIKKIINNFNIVFLLKPIAINMNGINKETIIPVPVAK